MLGLLGLEQGPEECAISTNMTTNATGHGMRPSAPMDDATVREWLWTFAEQTHDYAILLLDLDYTIRWANGGAARILGVAAEDMIGGPMHRFFTVEDRDIGIPQHEIDVALSAGSSEDDRWMLRGDGSTFWASGRSVALREQDGSVAGFLKMMRNQTDIKMRTSTFANRVIALEEGENARTVALATLSHELRNPLSALNMAAMVVAQHAQDARVQQSVDIIQRSVGFVARMIDDLEHATRITVGKLSLFLQTLTLHEELEAAIETARGRAGKPDRNIELLMPQGEPIHLEADRLRLQQVVANLVGNAIKFTGPGGHILVKGTVEGRNAVIRVSDDGAGIAPEMLETIFRMFTQADGSEKSGLGIGLALVKTIVELHGGSVQAKSDGIGKGSDFTVRIPLHKDEPPTMPRS